jgi:5-methylcytosine-specific restriction endonuclease McrA
VARAAKVCAEPGCPNLVTKGHCQAHARKPWSTGRHDHGGTSRTGTTEYFRWRKAVMSASKGQCQIKGPTCTSRATQADHIVPVAWGGAEHDRANGQGVCAPCHGVKTRSESRRGSQGVGGTP